MPIGEFSALLSGAASLTGTAVPRAVGIIGDDVAANAKQLMDMPKGRTLPAILKVIKGSLRNKAVMIPFALGLSWLLPGAILPLLAMGGFYLTAEAKEQLEGKGHGHDKKVPDTEKDKIANALKIDAVLSGEITALTLGIAASAPIMTQLVVLGATGLALTGILYGAIGAILGMGPLGKWLEKREGKGILPSAARKIGTVLVKAAPKVMKAVSVIGTAALFMVGGELMLHGIPGGEQLVTQMVSHLPVLQGVATHVVALAAGFAASFVSHPVVEALEKPAAKARDYIKSKAQNLFKKKPAKEAAPKAAPAAEAAPNALKNAPAVKADMNAAAKPAQAPVPAPILPPPAAPLNPPVNPIP